MAKSSQYVTATLTARWANTLQSFKVATEGSALGEVGYRKVVDGICVHNSHKPIFHLTL